jgi:hypothetical protein
MPERRIYAYGGFDPAMRVNPLEITPISVFQAQSEALRGLPRARARPETVLLGPDNSLRPAPGGLGLTAWPLERVNTRLRRPIRMYGGGDQPVSAPQNRRSATLADVLADRAGSAVVTDPALFEGSVAARTARPGAVRRTLTAIDLLANPAQAIAGVTPQQAQAVYSELIDPPNRYGQRLYQGPVPRPGRTGGYRRHDDTMFVDPTDWSTNLPSDVPIGQRGAGAAASAERAALLTDVSGFSSEDPSRVRTAARTGRRPVGGDGGYPERAQEVVVYRPDGTFEVRTVDPTIEARNVEIPIDRRLSAYNSDQQDYLTLGELVRQASEEAKTPLMPRSAVLEADRRGRVSPMYGPGGGEGSLIGTLSRTGSEPVPLYAPTVGGERLSMARDIANRFGKPQFESIKEPAYRPGTPLNRDVDGVLRPQLAEAFGEVGLPVVQTLVPSRNRGHVANVGTLQEAIRNGLQVRQSGGEPLGLEEVRALAESIRRQPWSPDAPRLYVERPAGVDATSGTPLQGPAELRRILLPQVQQDASGPGPMTGAFVRAVPGEAGPALLLGNPEIRKAAEAFMQRRGASRYESGIEGLTSALASQAGRPPQTGLNAPAAASPVVQQAARVAVQQLGGTAAVPGRPIWAPAQQWESEGGAGWGYQRVSPVGPLPEGITYRLMGDGASTVMGRMTPAALAGALPPAGSYGAQVLAQDVHSYLQGAVPLEQIAAALPFPERVSAPMPQPGAPDPMTPQGPASAWSPGRASTLEAALQQAAAAQVMGGDPRQMVLTADGRPFTGQFPYAPSYLDDVAAYMAASAPGARVMDRSPQGVQLALDLAGVTQQGRQMELPIALPQGVEESWANRTGRGLERLYARDAFGYDTRPAQQSVTAEQLNVPFRDITGDVRILEPELVGTGAGPYAGAAYTRTPLDRTAYQRSLVQGPQQAGAPGFDYGAMAEALGNEGNPDGPIIRRVRYARRLADGQIESVDRPVRASVPPVEPGSPAHRRAMAQMAMRIRARQGGLR